MLTYPSVPGVAGTTLRRNVSASQWPQRTHRRCHQTRRSLRCLRDQLVVELLRQVKIRLSETIQRVFKIDCADAGSRTQNANGSSDTEMPALRFAATRQVNHYQLIGFEFLSQQNCFAFSRMDSDVHQINIRLPHGSRYLKPCGRPRNPRPDDIGSAFTA